MYREDPCNPPPASPSDNTVHQKMLPTIKPPATAADLTRRPEGIQDGEKEETGPRELRCLSKGNFNEPRLLHLPIHRKALKSLT